MHNEQFTQKKQPSYRPKKNPSQKTVLVVEDDHTHRILMEKILEECGFQTILAEDGYIAISKIEARDTPFDLVIMDWDMPGLDGLETTREIRARQAKGDIPYTPIIAFTSNRMPGDRERCLSAGMDAYLPKDVWMPKWRQTLIDSLQGFVTGHFEPENFELTAQEPVNSSMTGTYDLEEFNQDVFEQTAQLLKNDLEIALEEFLEDAAAYIGDIKNGLAQSDCEHIARGSHTLKSNSKGFGLNAVAKISEEINTLTRDNTADEGIMNKVRTLFPQLQQAFYNGERRLRALIKTIEF